MFPRFRLQVTAERIRVERDGVVLLDEEAAIALRYDARLNSVQIVAIGDEAVNPQEKLDALTRAGVIDDGGRHASTVAVADAPWWERARVRGLLDDTSSPVPEPWEHHGEVVVVYPFAHETAVPNAWVLVLERALERALVEEATGARFPALHRWWMQRCARVAVVLPELPEDAAIHDAFVRSLRLRLGSRVMLQGAPARLRGKLSLEDRTDPILLSLLLITITFLCLHPLPSPWQRRVALLLSVVAVALLIRRDFRHSLVIDIPRDREIVSSGKDLRRYEAPPTKAEPDAYAGRGSFRLGLDEGLRSGWTALLLLGGLFGCMAFRFSFPTADAPRMFIFFCAMAPLGLLGTWIASARVSLGERGVAIRRHGWFGRVWRIPYTHIRSVISGDASLPCLRILFRDGRELRVGFTTTSEGRMRRLRDLEASIAPRITAPGSYRAAGRR